MMLTIVPCSLVFAGSLRVISTARPINSEAMGRGIEADLPCNCCFKVRGVSESDGMRMVLPHGATKIECMYCSYD